MEHEYKKPKIDDVEDAFDVSLLFSKYVERYWKRYRVGAGIDFYQEDKWVGVEIDPEAGSVNIFNGIGWDKPFKFSIPSSDDSYLVFLKDYLNIFNEW